MRLFRLLLAIAFLVAGIAVGALNPQPVSIDLGFTVLRASLGVSLILALLAGVIAGGLVVVASVVLPMRQGMRKRP
jgi:hypothetical protein